MTPRFLVIPPTLARLVVPRSVLEQTRTLLAGPGAQGFEATVLWLGTVASETEAHVAGTYFPRQYAYRTRQGLAVEVPIEEWTDLALKLAPGMFVLAKLHTHGEDAYHSEVDEANPYLSHEGAFAITIPYFARMPADSIEHWSVNVFRKQKWVELSPTQAIGAIVIQENNGDR